MISNAPSLGSVSAIDPERMTIRHADALYDEGIKHFRVFLKPPNPVKHLNLAIRYTRQSVSEPSEDDPNRKMRALGVAEMLHYRYQENEQPQDLDDALSFAEEAHTLMETDCDALPSCLWLLGVLNDSQYQVTGNVPYLDAALEYTQSAIKRAPNDREYHQACVMILIHRYEYFGHDEIRNLGKALQYTNTILSSPSQHLWPNAFHHRSVIYSFLHEETPQVGFLESALADARSFLSHITPENPDRPRSLQALAYILQRSFENEGNVDHLNEAVQIIEDAVQMLEPDNNLRLKCLNNFGLILENRFETWSDPKDLERAIHYSEQALDGVAEGAPQQLRWTVNLANQLGRYFGLTGRGEYLERAIRKLQNVSTSETLRPRDRIEAKSDLARFMTQHAKPGNTNDLVEAINLLQDCFGSFAKDHVDRLRHLIRYIDALRARYELIDEVRPSLKEAEAADEALSSVPPNHRQYAEWLEALARFWVARFELSHSRKELEKSISIFVHSTEASPEAHPSRYHRMFMLARVKLEQYLLYQRSGDTRASQCREQAVQKFVEAAESPFSFYWTRVMAARIAMKILALDDNPQWEKITTLGKGAVRLLPLLVSRYQSRQEQQSHMSLVYGLAAETCSACIKAGKHNEALRYLEYGRGVVIGYVIDSRSDVASLRKDQQDLAQEYDMLKMKLLQSHESVLSNVPDVVLREGRDLLRMMEDCLGRIRQVPGYETFLDIPKINELRACAAEGPIVVVNHTNLSSDAILVLPDRTITLPLPKMREKAPSQHISDVVHGLGTLSLGIKLSRKIFECSDSEDDEPAQQGVLPWLWQTCVEPILDKLTNVGALQAGNDYQRTWWIGAGNAATYPFHAAFAEDGKPGNDTLSRTIPSYVPSIKALSYARQLSTDRIGKIRTQKPKLLLVTMPTTPGKRALPGAEQEALEIQERCGKACVITTLRNKSADRVLQLLGQADLVHFACHGFAHPEDPSQSHLLMEIGHRLDPLDVSRMATVEKSKVAWVAYLSACSTAEIENNTLAEEGIHMCTALLLVGFPQVVGSLGEVDDNVSVCMARNFYEALLDANAGIYRNGAVAVAWRAAVVRTRAELQLAPEDWGAYVHSGA